MEDIGGTGNASGTVLSTSASPVFPDNNKDENDGLAMESTVTQSRDRLEPEPSAVDTVVQEHVAATTEPNTVSDGGRLDDNEQTVTTLENVQKEKEKKEEEQLNPEKGCDTETKTGSAVDETALQMADTDDTDESRDDIMVYSEDGAESDDPDGETSDGGPPQLEASIERPAPTVAPPDEETAMEHEENAESSKTETEALTREDKVVTPSGKTVREILLENASLKTQLANLMKEVDQRYRVTEELLQITEAQRDKMNQLPIEDCRLIKVWNSKKKENADVYLSREASDMLKQGMAIVLRKKSLPTPSTVNRDVSDLDSDVGDVITSAKKSRKGRKIRRSVVLNEADSESEAEKQIPKTTNKNKPPKNNHKRINAEAKIREAEIRRKKALVRKEKKAERERNLSESSKTKAENGPSSNNKASDDVSKPIRGRGRPKKSEVTEEDQEGQKKQRQHDFLANRNKISKLTNSKTAILPKIRSARIRARASVKTSANSLTKLPIVKLSKDDVENYGKEQKARMVARGKSGMHYSPEVERKLKELKRPTLPSPSMQFAAKRLQGLHADSKAVGSTKRKTFKPIRKPVVKAEQKDYIREIKELTQRGKPKVECTDNTDSLPDPRLENAESSDSLPGRKPRKLENSVLNIPLSPSKMKLLAARDVLKRKLTREDEQSPEVKRAKTTVPVHPQGSARTRGRKLVKEIETTFPETDFIKKLEELDSKNRPKAKPVPDNESSAKLSRLIDSVAGRLVASPVAFSEDSVESLDLKDGDIPTSVDAHRTRPPGALVTGFTPPANPGSGAALVGPMVPLGVLTSPQVSTAKPEATFSGEFVISKHAIGGATGVDAKTSSDVAKKDRIMIVRNSGESNKPTILVKMIPPARKGSGMDLNRSSGQIVMYANPSTQSPATDQNRITPDSGSSADNSQIRTVKASEIRTWNLKNMLRANRTVTEEPGSSASSVAPSISILKSNSVPFLVKPAPGVPEPEITKRTQINEDDLSFIDKNDDFSYDENYDSIQDILNLLDADASRDAASVRKANSEAGVEAVTPNEMYVDGERALGAAEAMVAMETEKNTKKRGGSQSEDDTEIPSPDLLSGLVHATIGDALDANEENDQFQNVATDQLNGKPALNDVVAKMQKESELPEERLESSPKYESQESGIGPSNDEYESNACDDHGGCESDVDMESVDEIVGEAPEIIPDSGCDDDDDSVEAESVVSELEEEEEDDEELPTDLMDEAEPAAEKCDDERDNLNEVADETNNGSREDDDLSLKDENELVERSETPNGSIQRSESPNESPERSDDENPPSEDGLASTNGRVRSPIDEASVLDDSMVENESETRLEHFRYSRDGLVADSDSDDSIGGECLDEDPCPATANGEEKTKPKRRIRRDSTRKSTSSNADEISPRKAILSVRKQDQSVNRGSAGRSRGAASQSRGSREQATPGLTEKSLKGGFIRKGNRNVPSKCRKASMGRKKQEPVILEPTPASPDLEISSYQVVAIIRQGRDHYSRCPRQMGTSEVSPPYQEEYSDFLMKFKSAMKRDTVGVGGKNNNRRGTSTKTAAQHLLLSIGGT